MAVEYATLNGKQVPYLTKDMFSYQPGGFETVYAGDTEGQSYRTGSYSFTPEAIAAMNAGTPGMDWQQRPDTVEWQLGLDPADYDMYKQTNNSFNLTPEQMGINPFLKQKIGDKEGVEYQWTWNEETQRYEPQIYWNGEWDTNADQREQLYAALAGLATMAGGAAAVGAGAGGAGGAGAAGGGLGSWTLPSLETLWGGTKAVIGGIGTANTVSNLTTGKPILGPGGHVIDTGTGGPTRVPTGGSGGGGSGGGSTGNGGGTVSNNTGGTGTDGTGTGGGGIEDILGLIFDVGGQAWSGSRQEKTADKLQAMYNDQQAKAAPWEQKLASSYTPEGIKSIMSSPEFTNEMYSKNQKWDRQAAKAGTLTNSMSGVLGSPELARGRDAARQRFGLEYLDQYRKPIADQVGMYTKNASDYKLLAALGLGQEQNIPSQWANTLAKYRNPNGGFDINRAVTDVKNAGGSIVNWWRGITQGSANPDAQDGTGGGTPGSPSTGGDPAHDNPDYNYQETIDPDGNAGSGWDYSQQDQGVITSPDGSVWMLDPVSGDWNIAELP